MTRHATEVWAPSGDRAPRPYGEGPGDAHTSAACGPQVHVYGQPGEQVECRLAHTGYDAPSVAELGGGLLVLGVLLAIGVRRLTAGEAKQSREGRAA